MKLEMAIALRPRRIRIRTRIAEEPHLIAAELHSGPASSARNSSNRCS